jgi:predicted nucleic acid-binding protein
VYLLDTNVVSELRRRQPHPRVVAWIEATPNASLRISAVTLGEIQRGVEMLRVRDAAKADEIEAWVDRLEYLYGIVPADAAVFRRHARLMHRQPTPSYEDALIAATAMSNGLVVVTRNVADFQGFELRVVNPFDDAA